MSPANPTSNLIIIGGGVIGLSCALHVADAHPDWRIVIVDAPGMGGVASRAAAGMLAPFAEFEEDGPLFRLCVESLDYYPEFLSKFCPDGPPMQETGILVPSGGASAPRAVRIAHFASQFAPINEIAGAELTRFEPALTNGRCAKALLLPGALINPRLLHDALRTAAAKRGIEIISSRVVAADEETVTLDTGEALRAPLTLLATGAWSQAIGDLFGVALPMRPVKGQVACIAAPDGFLRHIIHEHEIYLAPRPSEGVVIGATMEHAGFDARVEAEVVATLRSEAEKLCPGLRDFPVAESWAGLRPRLANGHPIIGRADGRKSLLIATGHYRNGILLTPVTGKRIAESIQDSNFV